MGMALFFSIVGVTFYKMFLTLPIEKQTVLEKKEPTLEQSKAAV